MSYEHYISLERLKTNLISIFFNTILFNYKK